MSVVCVFIAEFSQQTATNRAAMTMKRWFTYFMLCTVFAYSSKYARARPSMHGSQNASWCYNVRIALTKMWVSMVSGHVEIPLIGFPQFSLTIVLQHRYGYFSLGSFYNISSRCTITVSCNVRWQYWSLLGHICMYQHVEGSVCRVQYVSTAGDKRWGRRPGYDVTSVHNKLPSVAQCALGKLFSLPSV